MKRKKEKIKIVVEKTDTGFSAFAEDFPVYTTGKTMSELIDNAREAANLYFEENDQTVSEENICFEIDFQQFFQHYKILNARHLADRIGINQTLLSQYVHGRKKPSHAQTKKILEGIRQIGKELSELSLINK